MVNELSFFLKQMRRRWCLTQHQLAERSGVGIKLVRSIEQGKRSLRMDKVNQVLAAFDCELSPVIKRDCGVLKREFVVAELLSNASPSSYDMYGRVVLSSAMSLNLVSYWERVLFSWISSCLDISHKSLFISPDRSWRLPVSPHYDLLLDMLDTPTKNNELPIFLNGKKRLIMRSDWIEAMKRSGLSIIDAERVVEWGIDNLQFFKCKIRSSSIDNSSKIDALKKIDTNRLLLLNI